MKRAILLRFNPADPKQRAYLHATMLRLTDPQLSCLKDAVVGETERREKLRKDKAVTFEPAHKELKKAVWI